MSNGCIAKGNIKCSALKIGLNIIDIINSEIEKENKNIKILRKNFFN